MCLTNIIHNKIGIKLFSFDSVSLQFTKRVVLLLNVSVVQDITLYGRDLVGRNGPYPHNLSNVLY